MHKHYKRDEIALKKSNQMLDSYFPTGSNNEIKLIIYYSKFNTANRVMYNNFFPAPSYLI